MIFYVYAVLYEHDTCQKHKVTLEHAHTTTFEFLTNVSVSVPFTAYPKYPEELTCLFFSGCQMHIP